jgi:multicomponent Na+:H+ antiporter subunit G
VVIALLAVGIVVSTGGAIGILRMPDVYLRIQASTKTITLGALPVLLALVVAEGPMTNYGGRALLVAILLLVMNPVASHALARAAHKSGVPMWSGAVLDQAAERRPGARPVDPREGDGGSRDPRGGNRPTDGRLP